MVSIMGIEDTVFPAFGAPLFFREEGEYEIDNFVYKNVISIE